jgi:membrane-associated protein
VNLLDLLGISFKDLLNPQFYIDNGGLWMILFIVFAETGLFAGFFLPGDALLFVVGIFSDSIVSAALFETNNQWMDIGILWLLISIAGILGNFVGYWFGKKSGPFLFKKKDTFFFKKKYLIQAHEFYEKNGGGAIVLGRFIPFVRTFAPIVAGIVEMDYKKFVYYNITGCLLWVGSMLLGGHFLQKLIMNEFDFDLKEHLEVIVICIVALTTFPVLYNVFKKNRAKAKSARNKIPEKQSTKPSSSV